MVSEQGFIGVGKKVGAKVTQSSEIASCVLATFLSPFISFELLVPFPTWFQLFGAGVLSVCRGASPFRVLLSLHEPQSYRYSSKNISSPRSPCCLISPSLLG